MSSLLASVAVRIDGLVLHSPAEGTVTTTGAGGCEADAAEVED